MLLTECIDQKEKEQDFESVKIARSYSPVSWDHSNFLGSFSFLKGSSIDIDLKKLVSDVIKKDLDDAVMSPETQEKTLNEEK